MNPKEILAVKVFSANLERAIYDREVVTVGGGSFTHEELRNILRVLAVGVEAVKVAQLVILNGEK